MSIQVVDFVPLKEKIETEAAKGKINAEQALLFKTYALFDREKLPVDFRLGGRSSGQKVAKCGTPVLVELIQELSQSYEKLSPQTRAEIEKYIKLKKAGASSYQVEYQVGED